jgi:hypothetical protein
VVKGRVRAREGPEYFSGEFSLVIHAAWTFQGGPMKKCPGNPIYVVSAQ